MTLLLQCESRRMRRERFYHHWSLSEVHLLLKTQIPQVRSNGYGAHRTGCTTASTMPQVRYSIIISIMDSNKNKGRPDMYSRMVLYVKELR